MKQLTLYICLIIPFLTFAQVSETDSIWTNPEIVSVNPDPQADTPNVDYLTYRNPMKASLYSAVFPGMGQLYNKKWWKVPIVWGILGTGAAVIISYNNQYQEYRGYYLDKLYGNPIENPTINNLSKEQLARIQDDRKRSRDYAIALTALAYMLNILDATVDAHLYGVNKDPDLSFKPSILQNNQTNDLAIGIGLNYKF